MAEINKNMLSPLGFSFHIKKLPELNFFVQSVDLPGISFGEVEVPTPFKRLPFHGDRWEYSGNLTISFKVNEDLGNYLQILEWLQGLAFPDKFEQFKKLKEKDDQLTGDGIYSDGYLMILSSAMNPIVRLDFVDLFPISLGNITMDSRDTGVEYIESTVDFKFTRYTWTTSF